MARRYPTGAETKFTDYVYQGVTTPIYVDANGRFGAKFHDEWFERKSLEDLKGALREKIRAQGKVAIEASRIDNDNYDDEDDPGPTFQDVVITGIDQRRGAFYYDTTDEDKHLETYHRHGHFYRRLTPGEKDHFTQLVRQRRALTAAIEKFKEEREIDVEEAVAAVMRDRLAQPATEEGA